MDIVGLIAFINALGLGNSFVEFTTLTASISIYPIIIAVVLGAVTIYLSSLSAARRASKVSPIENIRNVNDIKINKNKIKTPRIIKRLFKTGGVIAYKNLKRSNKKYRTTVISLIISIFSFISMSGLMEVTLVQNFTDFSEYYYDIKLTEGVYELNDNQIKNIINMKQVDESHVVYDNNNSFKIWEQTKFNDKIVAEYFTNEDNDKNYYSQLELLAMDSEAFKEYANELGLDSDSIGSQGILCDGFGNMKDENDK